MKLRVCFPEVMTRFGWHVVRLALPLFAISLPTYAQTGGTSPWEHAVEVLQESVTHPIARGLSLVAIVVGGLTIAFGGSKRVLAGIIFGVGMAVAAANFLMWLFNV